MKCCGAPPAGMKNVYTVCCRPAEKGGTVPSLPWTGTATALTTEINRVCSSTAGLQPKTIALASTVTGNDELKIAGDTIRILVRIRARDLVFGQLT
jgi:hypothetical protein